MKKFALATILLLSFSIPGAEAATPVIMITDKPHTGFDGKFRDNELATSLMPDGKLGKLVSSISNARETWVIDPALIEEVIDMSDGYSIKGKEDEAGQAAAVNWLAQLKFSIGNSPVIALPYGNPDQSLVKRLAPSELNFYSTYAQEKLESQLGRSVTKMVGARNLQGFPINCNRSIHQIDKHSQGFQQSPLLVKSEIFVRG